MTQQRWKFPETEIKLNGAEPGEPCPALPPLFARVLSMRSYFVDFHRQCKQTTISQTAHSNLTNLTEILFKSNLVKAETHKGLKRVTRVQCS